jgi:hypothetical protein
MRFRVQHELDSGAQRPADHDNAVGAGEAYDLRPGHFVQTIEPVKSIEITPVEEYDRSMATAASNVGLLAS